MKFLTGIVDVRGGAADPGIDNASRKFHSLSPSPPPEWMKFSLRMTVYFLKPGSGLICRAILRGDILD